MNKKLVILEKQKNIINNNSIDNKFESKAINKDISCLSLDQSPKFRCSIIHDGNIYSNSFDPSAFKYDTNKNSLYKIFFNYPGKNSNVFKKRIKLNYNDNNTFNWIKNEGRNLNNISKNSSIQNRHIVISNTPTFIANNIYNIRKNDSFINLHSLNHAKYKIHRKIETFLKLNNKNKNISNLKEKDIPIRRSNSCFKTFDLLC